VQVGTQLVPSKYESPEQDLQTFGPVEQVKQVSQGSQVRVANFG